MSVNAQEKIQPREIKKIGSSQLEITWGDGHRSLYRPNYLRAECMCAVCIDEMTGRRKILPGMVPDDLQILTVELVGQYALHFDWSDGHNTGIYPFGRLRELCPCRDCSGA
jgi:DUF971 family protein